MTRFFHERRELSFRETVRHVRDHARASNTSEAEIESLIFLVKSAADGDQGSQLFLVDFGIISAADDGTSIWGETGHAEA
jgi:hypothetical protein